MEKSYVECACHSDEHMHMYTLDLDDPSYPAIYVTHHLATDNFWHRLLVAAKYLFGYRCKFGDFDESIIQDSETAIQIRDIMSQLIEANSRLRTEKASESASSHPEIL